MGRILNGWPRAEMRGSIYTKYLDGRVWKVAVGEVGKAKDASSLRANLAVTAKRAGLGVRTRVIERGKCVVVQAYALEE